jgi:hypothetical protein
MDKLRKEHPVIAFLSDVSGATAASEYAVEMSAKSEAGDYAGVDIALDAVQITGINLVSRLFDASLIGAGVNLVPQARGALRAAEGSVASQGVSELPGEDVWWGKPGHTADLTWAPSHRQLGRGRCP